MKMLISLGLLLGSILAASTPQTPTILVKSAPAPGAKSQPGPADRPKDRAADSRLMAAQPHLIPEAVNIPKEEVRDEAR